MRTGAYVDDTVNSVKVGGEGAVVILGGEDQFGEALDGVGWVFRE